MNWQSIVALLIVALAAAWLARRALRIIVKGLRGGEGEISSCGSCHKNPAVTKTTQVVQLEKKKNS